MRNPGKIIQLNDGRKVIMFDNQPLLKIGKPKIILHLIDKDFNSLKDENGKNKTLLVFENDERIKNWKLIGYVD